MDYHMFFAGVGASCALIAIMSSLVWLIISLVTKPIREDVDEIKKDIRAVLPIIKSDDELNRMIEIKTNMHRDLCTKNLDTKISVALENHIKIYHKGG